MTHFLWVPGRPKPKQRHRMTRRGRAFTPQATVEYEQLVARSAHEWGVPPVAGPVMVEMDLYGDGAGVWVTPLGGDAKSALRGDIDNYVKSILDGLQRGHLGDQPVIANDRQVTYLVADQRRGDYPAALTDMLAEH